MDRSLDEIISERPSGRPRPEPRRQAPPPRAPRREEYPRDGVRKYRRDEPVNIDSDWVHDRFDDDRYERARDRPPRRPPIDTYGPPPARGVEADGAKLRVDNLHYELTENDLRELFERIGRVVEVRLLYDRMDRSQGTAFVTYANPRDARHAVQDFDGQNANGQPISLTMLPSAPAAVSRGHGSLFERVESRSLFDRIEGGPDSRADSREDFGRRRRNRSESPRRRPAPEHIDRYVPGGRRGGSRSPIRRRGTPREVGRRPGQRREDNGRAGGGRRGGKADDDGPRQTGGRPRKTAQELDAEMEDYWGSKPDETPKSNGAAAASNNSNTGASAVAAAVDDDIDMIE